MDLAAFRQAAERIQGHLATELSKLHTGRPSTGLVEDIPVSYQGSSLSIKQLATITVPAATSIVITPWDRANLAAIETAIRDSSTGLSPVNNGEAVRVTVPPLSEERRLEYAKIADAKLEQAKVSLRTQRHELLSRAKREWDEGKTPEDVKRREEDALGKALTEATREIEKVAELKKRELTGR